MTTSKPVPLDGARYGVYFAPPIGDPLWAFGSQILGRDAARGQAVAFPPALLGRFPRWSGLVAPATHYGFHATLKAPFEPAPGIAEARILADTARLAARLSRVELGHLAVTALGRFVALRPVALMPALQALAASVVEQLDHLRAPLTETDRARRKPDTLSPKMRAYLDRWGYPYVLDEFRFHMTLSGPLQDDDRHDAAHIIRGLFSRVDRPVLISDLCVFKQMDRVSPFFLLARVPLRA